MLYWQSLAGDYADPIADDLDAALLTPALTPRRLTLLREAVPTLRRVAVLWNPSNAHHQPQVDALRDAARELGLALVPCAVRRPADFGDAFAAIGASEPTAWSSCPPRCTGSTCARSPSSRSPVASRRSAS